MLVGAVAAGEPVRGQQARPKCEVPEPEDKGKKQLPLMSGKRWASAPPGGPAFVLVLYGVHTVAFTMSSVHYERGARKPPQTGRQSVMQPLPQSGLEDWRLPASPPILSMVFVLSPKPGARPALPFCFPFPPSPQG